VSVVSMLHTTNATLLQARADAIKTNLLADLLALRAVAEANSDRMRRATNAYTQAELFNAQLPAYLAAPSVYMKRMYLEAFVQAIAGTRTYVLLSTNVQPVGMFNHEPKIRSDLMDIALPPPPAAKPN